MSNECNPNKNFCAHMSSALQNSRITGLPEISEATSSRKKAQRVLVFILCVAGFIYQSVEFLNLYWEYDTITDVKVTMSPESFLPAFTICNNNGIYSSKVCKVFPDVCEKISRESNWNTMRYCNCFPRFCSDGVPRRNPMYSGALPQNFYQLPQERMRDAEQPFSDLVTACYTHRMHHNEAVAECKLTNIISVRSSNHNYYLNICYTLFSLQGKPNAKPGAVLSSGYIALELDTKVDEYPTPIEKASVQVGFHDPRALANPYSKGFSLSDNMKHTFVLKKSVKKLLPEPYRTRCVDYVKIWNENGGDGPVSQMECIERCDLNASMKVLNCVRWGLKYPTNEIPCKPSEVGYFDIYEIVNASEECQKACGPACWEETYKAMHYQDPLDAKSMSKGGTKMNGTMLVNIKFDNMETITYTTKPQFEEIELLMYIGGYMGMWLGVSLLSLFDIMEMLLILVKYPLLKLRGFRQRRTGITHS